MTDRRQIILVVDDMPDWRTTLSGLLEDVGYQVWAAGTVAESLEQLEAHEIDLAVIDLSLDISDEGNTEGLELAKEIRRRWPRIHSLIITAHDSTETLVEAMRPDSGGQRLVETYVPKVEADKLVNKIDQLLGVSRGA
jgi:two-component system nitrogen regulation response regulator NtrX